MEPMPFRLRIALLSALVSGVVLAAFGGACWYWIGRAKLESVDTQIRSLGARHPGWFANRGSYERLNSALEFIFGDAEQTQLILLVKDSQGRTLYTSPGWPAEIVPGQLNCSLADDPEALELVAGGRQGFVGATNAPGGGGGRRGQGGRGLGLGPGGPPMVTFTKTPRFQTVHTADGAWRLGMLGTAETTLVIGLDYAPVQAELDRVRGIFFIALPAALLLIGAGGWVVAGRAMRPLRNIAQTAERVTARGLDQRIAVSIEDPEITRLIQVLNRMIDRLEASFHQATRFSADASHELKTPLAVMQGELENALQSAPTGSPEQQVFANLLEETQRLKAITRSLLLLAQADAGQLPLTLEPINLSAALGGLTEDLEALAAESRLEVRFNAEPDLRVRADWPLLRQAIMNLLHNAVRYNDPAGYIEVTLASRNGQVELEVTNSGPGIPASDQARVFDRFFRVDTARGRRTDGVGLGLSLAREIVGAHQGRLVLKEGRPGRTRFALILPGEHSAGAADTTATQPRD
ncbi:MAG: HAMP domain-containing protein [Verrucomicrobia bacterium]|nr:HAMP domain-containing protein [Verrucomicrobiota bacterium]